MPATARIASRSSSASRVSIWMQQVTSVVGGAQVFGRVASVLRGSTRGDAAQPDRRIAAPGDRPLGVGDRPDLGHDDPARAGVERVHDPDRLVGGHPVEDRHAGGAGGDQHLDEVGRRDRAVLTIGHEQVEAGAGHQLGHGRVEDRQPRPEQEVAARQPGAEVGHHRRVLGEAHGPECKAVALRRGRALDHRLHDLDQGLHRLGVVGRRELDQEGVEADPPIADDRLGDLLGRPGPERQVAVDSFERRPIVVEDRPTRALGLGDGAADRDLAADRPLDPAGSRPTSAQCSRRTASL